MANQPLPLEQELRLVVQEIGGLLAAARSHVARQVSRALSKALTTEFGKGFSRANLQNMRSFLCI